MTSVTGGEEGEQGGEGEGEDGDIELRVGERKDGVAREGGDGGAGNDVVREPAHRAEHERDKRERGGEAGHAVIGPELHRGVVELEIVFGAAGESAAVAGERERGGLRA